MVFSAGSTTWQPFQCGSDFVEIEDVNVGEDGHGSLQTGSTKTLKPGNV